MVKIEKKIHGTSMQTVWFAEKEVDDRGIITYMEAAVPIAPAEKFETFVTDLTEDEEDIKKHFSKGCLYKVNRASREAVTYQTISKEEISNDMIDEFLIFFEEFWKSKGTVLADKESLRADMLAYAQMNALTISCAYIEGKKVVYHTHIGDGKTARLWHSASLFRVDSENLSNKNLIGIANRALHYDDMRFFKSKGYTSYDWGGAGLSEDVASITEFKASFGGRPVTYYNGTKANGLKAKSVLAISKIKTRIVEQASSRALQ